ncbi:MAG: hypothetical protein VXY79_02450 [Bacteroidota bacterium]|nr:hypothetical protein [Bacteroidota bacterium]
MGVFNITAQHLVGARSSSVAQNYKLPSYSHHRFEGFSGKQIAKQESKRQKEEEKLKKQLLTSHIKKQSKATQKRMKSSLKKSKRLLNNQSITPVWLVWVKRKKAFSQRKQNKYED